MESIDTSMTSGLGHFITSQTFSMSESEEIEHPIFKQIDEENIATIKHYITTDPVDIISLVHKEMTSIF